SGCCSTRRSSPASTSPCRAWWRSSPWATCSSTSWWTCSTPSSTRGSAMPAPDGGLDLEPAATLAPGGAPAATREPVDAATGAATPTGGRWSRQGRLGRFGVLDIAWLAFVTLAPLLAPVPPLDDPSSEERRVGDEHKAL